jgi:hypothetical protein
MVSISHRENWFHFRVLGLAIPHKAFWSWQLAWRWTKTIMHDIRRWYSMKALNLVNFETPVSIETQARFEDSIVKCRSSHGFRAG